MLLHSITEHVRRQNWTAVVLEFVIVVFGVFVGLEAANWNDSVRNASKEAVVLEQLHQEFVAAIERTRESKDANENYQQASLEVLGIIRDGVEPTDRATFLKTIERASRFGAAPIEPTTLVELVSSGGLSDLSSAPLRTALVNYHETIINHQSVANLVLQRISTPHDGFHAAVILNPDFRIEGQPLLLDYDWDCFPETREQFQVLVYGKASLAGQMETLIAEGEAVISEIEAAQQ